MDWFGGESLFTPFLEAKEEIGDLRESEKTQRCLQKGKLDIVLPPGCLLVRRAYLSPLGVWSRGRQIGGT